MEVFKLFGSILVNSDSAQKSISQTGEKAEGLGSKLMSGIGTAAKWGAAIGGAAVVGATALYGVATKATEAMDAIDKGSAKIGISKKAYQEWDYVLGQNGMSIDKLQVGMKTLVSKMDAVKSGNKDAAQTFSQLGISVTDSSGKLKSQEEMLNESLYALAGMENGTEKARLATELFGKSGVEMMPMLNGGAEGMKDLTKRAHELGLVVSDEAVDAGVVLGDTMDDVKDSIGMLVTKIGISAMPMIQEFCDWIIAHMPEIQATFEVVFGAVSLIVQTTCDIITFVVTSIMEYIDSLNINWNEVFTTISQIFFDTINTIVEIWTTHLQPCIQAICDFIMNVLWPIFQEVFVNLILPLIENAFNHIINLWENILKPAFTGILDFLTGIFTLDFQKIWSGITSILSSIWNSVTSILWTPIQTAIDLIGGVVELIKAPFVKAADAIDGIWKGIKSVFKLPHFTFEGSWNPLDWIDDGLPEIGVEWYAKGGIMNGPTVFGMNGNNLMVGGEKEPEVIAPLSDLEKYYKEWSNDKNEPNIINQFNISELNVREDRDIERIAEELYYLQKKKEVA
ncbi:MAG: hypothetical protein PHC62_03855 [Candidatus Izemoplasmatales bacterium]|nr:hypothetical protein [Candidatus Izemoplasmatales bacterium]